MRLGNILKNLKEDQEVTISIAEVEYTGTVEYQSYSESTKDPVSPWYDPGGVTLLIDLDQNTVEELDLEITTLRVTCGQFEDFPRWKTPVGALYEDGEEKTELGDVTDIQTDDQ